ncbi:hypothetical protein K1F50_16455 [Muricauda oceani]|uniref:Uncharacterized protein n=1 Tax=Flagellimonas oceani TaxID=2698672 RepID=A0A6G7IXS5_9FLAO|nr:hypothetical protein [Allomuricauda oceani]MBW8244403.1 hypothetical protein [Allomuricauda oceani]QII43189.1 hypothetical protein GVT53_00270 [Allomuricauda oceani]
MNLFKTKNERIKDILIDFVYDHCYNEIVQRMEGDGSSITYDDPSALKEPRTERFVEQLTNSKQFRAYYTTRGTEFCQIISNKQELAFGLSKRLQNSGFKIGNKLDKQVQKVRKELIMKSYFIEGNPIKSKIKLTEKGLRHYLDGKSFEDQYLNRRNSNIAIVVSIFSILIAIASLFIKRID